MDSIKVKIEETEIRGAIREHHQEFRDTSSELFIIDLDRKTSLPAHFSDIPVSVLIGTDWKVGRIERAPTEPEYKRIFISIPKSK